MEENKIPENYKQLAIALIDGKQVPIYTDKKIVDFLTEQRNKPISLGYKPSKIEMDIIAKPYTPPPPPIKSFPESYEQEVDCFWWYLLLIAIGFSLGIILPLIIK